MPGFHSLVMLGIRPPEHFEQLICKLPCQRRVAALAVTAVVFAVSCILQMMVPLMEHCFDVAARVHVNKTVALGQETAATVMLRLFDGHHRPLYTILRAQRVAYALRLVTRHLIVIPFALCAWEHPNKGLGTANVPLLSLAQHARPPAHSAHGT